MKTKLILPALAIFMGFQACNSDTNKENTAKEAQETMTITHELGTVDIPKNPEKVVALDYASVETLRELDIPIIGTAKSHLPHYLSELQSDESVVDLGTLFEVNYEELSSLDPDVIFISARMQTIYPELSEIAPTVFLQTDQSDVMGSFKNNARVYGEIFDKEEETNQAIQELEKKVDALRQKASESGQKALVLLYNNGKFSAFGKGSRFGIIHDVFGFEEAVKDLESARHGQAVSNEFIQQANPDFIFIIDRSAVVNQEATDKESIENVLVQQTNAYKNGKIIYLDPAAWYISGEGLTSMKIMIEEVSSSL